MTLNCYRLCLLYHFPLKLCILLRQSIDCSDECTSDVYVKKSDDFTCR